MFGITAIDLLCTAVVVVFVASTISVATRRLILQVKKVYCQYGNEYEWI